MTYPSIAPCTLSETAFRAVARELEQMPERIAQLLVGLDQEQLHWRPGSAADAFSCTEHIHHLRDLEIEGYSQRLRRMLAEVHPSLPDIDGTQLAVARAYNQQPIAGALAAFTLARRDHVRILAHVTKDQLERTAELEGVGSITLAQLSVRWRQHDAGHLTEIGALRARLIGT